MRSDTTVAAIEARGGSAFGFAGDITRDDVVEEFARRVFERFGRVDVLVNNAGISLIRAAEETTAEEYRRVMEVNLVAPFLLAGVWQEDARGSERGDRECGVDRGAGGGVGSSGLQRFETRISRTDAHAGRGVGRARGPGERRLTRVGEDGDGCGGPGGRELRGRRHYAAGADGTVCAT